MPEGHFPLMSARQRRQHLQLPAGLFSSRLGITVTTYNRFERGERRAYLDQALVIAQMLDCTVEDLGRPLTPEEEVELFRRGRERKAQGLPTAGTNGDGIGTVVDAHASTPAPANEQPAPELTDEERHQQLIAEWSSDDDGAEDDQC